MDNIPAILMWMFFFIAVIKAETVILFACESKETELITLIISILTVLAFMVFLAIVGSYLLTELL